MLTGYSGGLPAKSLKVTLPSRNGCRPIELTSLYRGYSSRLRVIAGSVRSTRPPYRSALGTITIGSEGRGASLPPTGICMSTAPAALSSDGLSLGPGLSLANPSDSIALGTIEVVPAHTLMRAGIMVAYRHQAYSSSSMARSAASFS